MNTRVLLLSGLLYASATMAQTPTAADSTGLPGDDLSLQGALELFRNAKDMEAFEKALNNPDNKVNNLDLNKDGNVDYIRVVDIGEGDIHAITLRVPVSEKESQDVAVIELEKTGDKSARVLIRGDVLLYGDSVLLEPVSEVMKQEKGAGGPAFGEAYPVFVWVNVWGWPCVSYIYAPAYVYWDSPWYWGYYPGWYRPWRPWGWSAWYGYSYHYHGWCRPVYYNAPTDAYGIYAPRRSMSTRVAADTRPVREARAAQGARSPYLRDSRTAAERRDATRDNMRTNTGRTEVQRSTDRSGSRREMQSDRVQQGRDGSRAQPRDTRGSRPDRTVQPRQRAPREARPSAPSRSQPRTSPGRSAPRRGR
ncbi:MAG TPA: hypothetical protein VGE21_16485 [Flavobacteriales bacterium]